MSKSVKTIVSVVAAIAIPFAAPAIASSIGLSAAIGTAVGSATAGSVIGGALTGAALGAAKGAILGENIGRNALMGAVGGGIGGYTSAPSPTSSVPPASIAVANATPDPIATLNASQGWTTSAGAGATGATAGGLSTAGSNLTGGLSGAMAPTDFSLASNVQFPASGATQGGGFVGLRPTDPGFFNAGVNNATALGTGVDYSLAAYQPTTQAGLSVVSANPVTGGTQVVSGDLPYTAGGNAAQSTTPLSAYSGGSYAPAQAASMTPTMTAGSPSYALTPQGAGTPPPAAPKTFAEAAKAVPDAVAAKFRDPNALADLTLRAGGMLAGSLIAGDGLSAEEKGLLDAQAEELRELRRTNQSLFNQRLEQAQNLLGEAKYFDPEYFGLQRARRAQLAGAKAKAAGLRGLTGARRDAEERRFDLATGRDTATAYDQGYGAGVQGRLQTTQAGLSAMPGYMPYSTPALSAQMAGLDYARARRFEQQRSIGELFGSLTGRS